MMMMMIVIKMKTEAMTATTMVRIKRLLLVL